jgi:transcriptional regulator with PAS, ATPase and Fis domain
VGSIAAGIRSLYNSKKHTPDATAFRPPTFEFLRIFEYLPMAKSRSFSAKLGKLFDQTSTIVYLIGSDRTILYANDACADWTNVEIEQLIGAKLAYSSERLADETADKTCGLCPNPEILDNLLEQETNQQPLPSFNIAARLAENQTVFRLANAFKLDTQTNQNSILIISSGDDLNLDSKNNSSIEADTSSTPDQLHTALRAIRAQTERVFSVDSLIGISPLSSRLRRQAKIAAECKSDLLIVGPPGSGREHLARTIHALRESGNDPGLLIPLPCAVADQSLIHVTIGELLAAKRADAKADPLSNQTPRVDWLLLKDVDQLTPAGQLELLGFLQLPDFPLRIVSTATTRLLDLAQGEDYPVELAHQLSSMTIELANLHERAEDIPLLAQAFLERENLRRDRQLSGFDKASLQLLSEYKWPGNLSQLQDMVVAAAEKTEANQITSKDLPKKFIDSISAQRTGSLTETEIQLDEYLQKIERELLKRAIRQAKGNKTKAAKLLGISRAKLLRRIQQFNLTAEPDGGLDGPELLEPSAFKEIE